ncbi:MAG: hypothetical protein KDB27_32955, partial [Planctomycetales bacterium]|nr:hypothetical protein [Planctomycetales bacterium]
NDEGHALIAKAILERLGFKYKTPNAELLQLATKKHALLRDAWLTETGHKRPGVAKGLPIEDARKEAGKLDAAAAELCASLKNQ